MAKLDPVEVRIVGNKIMLLDWAGAWKSRSLAMRKQESADIMQRFRAKLPVIVEKYDGEKYLPDLDRTKFIVPDDMTLSQFTALIRLRLRVKPHQAFYLMVGNRALTLSRTMAEIYYECQDLDGFLYFTYAAHEMYG